MKYKIKHNLPDGIIKPCDGTFTDFAAIQHFMGLVSFFITNGYETSHFLRNEWNKPLRGSIEVNVNGFYYYVELMPV